MARLDIGQMTKIQEKFSQICPSIDMETIDEMCQNIIETEPLKLKILKRVKCKKCGWCCKYQSAMLTPGDIIRLCKHFKCDYSDLEKYIDQNIKMPYLKSPCPFLDIDNKCTIYHIRPNVCKIFPFVDFFLVIKPCLLGEEILNIMKQDGRFIFRNEDKYDGDGRHRDGHDDNHLQKLYNDRIKMLDHITGMDESKGVEYDSIFVDKIILGKLIKVVNYPALKGGACISECDARDD